MKTTNLRIFSVLAAGFLVIALFIAFGLNGIGDEGDSVMHYLFSRYAFQHPALFFDHWAKPFFVLCSALWAQLSMLGMKLFNILCTLVTMYGCFRIAQHFEMRYPWLVAVIIPFTPVYTPLVFSGLTEPFFAAMLSIAILLTIRHRYMTAVIIVSFMPFMRSEGLIFMGLFGLYFLIINRWKYIPVLALGHIVYGLVGSIYNGGDIFWVISKIPYARRDSVYGSGDWFHYVDGLFNMLGPVLFVFLLLGLLYTGILLVQKKSKFDFNYLIVLSFLVFLFAQSAFWALGIFNSMGLYRVFNAVLPLMTLLILYGISAILGLLGTQLRGYALSAIVLLIGILPFTENNAAWNLKEDFTFQKEDLMKAVCDQVWALDESGTKIYYYDPKVVYFLQLDPWDDTRTQGLNGRKLENLNPSDILVWDNWYGPLDGNLSLEELENRFPDVEKYVLKDDNFESQYVVMKVR